MVRISRTTLKILGGGLMTAALFLFVGPVSAQDDSSVTPLLERVVPKSNPTVFQDSMNVAPLARATIFVRDIDESLKLYRDILGLRPMFDNYWKGSGINAIMGTDGLELRATVLMAGESVSGNLGIYQLHNDETTPPPSQQTPDTRTGDFAIVFPTNDIHRLTAEITAAGYPIVSPPVPLIIREEYEVQPVEMMFRDPDGVLVNLVQAGVLKKK
ncbi:MAG: VOC family protein [Rhodospirillaceae bacterium]|nr:VOC family protein [Rhodospirillaceae bacterium]MBT5566772.1 VOC family protein [Rhodospirillaceae bacterium]